MSKLNKIVYLSEAQKDTLFHNNSITINGKTIIYNDNDLYLTPLTIVTGVKGDNENQYRSGNINITKDNIGLGKVENTKLSEWTGSEEITTIGTLTKGIIPWARLSNIPSATTTTPGIIQIGTGVTNAAAGNHIHAISLNENNIDSSQITLNYGKKYKLTAGSNSVTFTMPNNTTVSNATIEDTTATRFVYSITQNDNGVISVITRPLPIYNDYILPKATNNNLGGIKIGYSTSSENRNYAIKIDNDGNAYVNVPWEDTHQNISGKVNKSGDTMTGFLTLHQDPESDFHAATKRYVDNILTTNDALVFKGVLGTDAASGMISSLPSTYKQGWVYKVGTAGEYAGQQCEIGDTIYCIKSGSTANNNNWTVIQTNIEGTVIGPSESASGIAVFTGTTGKAIKDSGFTIGTSVPANAVFTDTWIANTKTTNGYVTAPGEAANKVWRTDAQGNPGWYDAPNIIPKVSITADGYVTKLPGNTTTFFRGDGSYSNILTDNLKVKTLTITDTDADEHLKFSCSGYNYITIPNETTASLAFGRGANSVSTLVKLTTTTWQPERTNEISLGESGKRWSKLYVGTADTYGSNTQPIYWNAGVPTAITYTANRLYYPSTVDAFTAGTHYISDTKIAINSTSIPNETLYVNGTEKIANDTDATSNSAAALMVVGGLAVGKKVNIGTLDGGQHIINGNVQLNAQSGSYNEGLRINRSTTGYANIYLGGVRSSASEAETGGWLIGTLSTPNNATSTGDSITNTVFTISNNTNVDTLSIKGTRGATIGTDSGWAIRPRLAIGTTYQIGYNLYVNGTSYHNGDDTHAGNLSPDADNTRSLGVSGIHWKNLFIGTADSYGSTSQPIYWNNGVPTAIDWHIGNSSTGESDCNNITYNMCGYYNANGPTTANSLNNGLGAVSTDGAIYSQAYNSNQVGQIAQDYRNGNLFIRSKNNGTWQDWKRVLTTNNNGLGSLPEIQLNKVNIKTWTDNLANIQSTNYQGHMSVARFFTQDDENVATYDLPCIDSHNLIFNIGEGISFKRLMNFDIQSNAIYVRAKTGGAAGENWGNWEKLATENFTNEAYVKKIGDTMTGSLYLQRNNGNLYFKNPDITLGTTPDTSGKTQLWFQDSVGQAAGLLENQYDTDGTNRIRLWCNQPDTNDRQYKGMDICFRADCSGADVYFTSCDTVRTNKTYGAVWNDYAECREVKENIEPGRCVIETGKGDLILSTARLQAGAEIISDTFGFCIGETKTAKTPIATTGRVLAYPYEDKNTYIPGQPVCSGPNGTISQMTDEEASKYPWKIIGTVSEIPNYDIWSAGNQNEENTNNPKEDIRVNGRIWIRIR